jgi:methionyl-tRNA synthetase
MRLAAEVNKYLDKAAPWFEIKTNKDAAAKSAFTGLKAVDNLKILFSPFLPFSSERLHSYLGYTTPIFGEQVVQSAADRLGEHAVLRYQPGSASGKWQPSRLEAGQLLLEPRPLFKKLEPGIVEEERARLG